MQNGAFLQMKRQEAGASSSDPDQKQLWEAGLRLYFYLKKHKQFPLSAEARVFMSNYQFYLENLLS